MSYSVLRTLLAGVLGGMAFNGAVVATFVLMGLGLNQDGILLDPSIQSPKLVAVWTSLDPLPVVLTNPPIVFGGFVVFAVAHAFLYRSVASAWPAALWDRIGRLALVLYVLPLAFFEFFTPYNLFGEPLPLLAVELAFWGVAAFVEAAVIVIAAEWGSADGPSS